MRYVMNQKVFSIGDKFVIRDEQGNDMYYVQGEIFSFGHKLSFMDISGRELLYIRQEHFTFSPTYQILRNGQPIAEIKKELFTFFHCKYDISSAYGDLQVEGEFLDHEYTFSRNGNIIANVTKEWLTWGDTYGIEIADNEDHAFFLACVVVIDMVCHGDENR